jgi:hypothetical protein
MRFHSPLDDVQWKAAVKTYSDLRLHLRTIRHEFPPRSGDERRLLKAYRATLQDFGRELRKPRDRIDSSRLNSLSDLATQQVVDYMVLCQMRRLD